MTIADRNFKGGETLERVYKGKRYECAVVKNKDGSFSFVHAGVTYKSVSGPSCFIMKSRGGTGWNFWTLAEHKNGKTPAAKTAKTPDPKHAPVKRSHHKTVAQ